MNELDADKETGETSDKLKPVDTRRVSLLSDMHEKNDEEAHMDEKKFKNITSTPAALHSYGKNSIGYYGNKAELGSGSKYNKSSMDTRLGLNTSDGLYFGRAKHTDASFIKVFYQRKLVHLQDQADKENANGIEGDLPQDLICVWISRDPYSDKSIIDYSLDQSQVRKVQVFMKGV
jgi:hypothetical protein